MAYDIVSFLTSKGGAGKTILANSLCFAAGMSYYERYDHVIYTLTDSRQQLDDSCRPYEIYAAKSNDEIDDLIGKARVAEGSGLIVIDGAGGNPAADQRFFELSDLTLIPMSPMEESKDCAAIYACQMPGSYILPNIWSPNQKASDVDQDYITNAAELIGDPSRILPPMAATHSVNMFVRPDFHYANISPRAAQFSKTLLGAVITLLDRKKRSQQ